MATVAGTEPAAAVAGCRLRRASNSTGRIKLSRELMLRLTRALSEIKPNSKNRSSVRDCDPRATAIVNTDDEREQTNTSSTKQQSTSHEYLLEISETASELQVGELISNGHVVDRKEQVDDSKQVQHPALNGFPSSRLCSESELLESPQTLATTTSSSSSSSEKNKGYHEQWPAHRNKSVARTFTWSRAQTTRDATASEAEHEANKTPTKECSCSRKLNLERAQKSQRHARPRRHARQVSLGFRSCCRTCTCICTYVTSAFPKPGSHHDHAHHSCHGRRHHRVATNKDLWPLSGAFAEQHRAARGRRLNATLRLRAGAKAAASTIRRVTKKSQRQTDRLPVRSASCLSAQMDSNCEAAGYLRLLSSDNNNNSSATAKKTPRVSAATKRHLGQDDSSFERTVEVTVTVRSIEAEAEAKGEPTNSNEAQLRNIDENNDRGGSSSSGSNCFARIAPETKLVNKKKAAKEKKSQLGEDEKEEVEDSSVITCASGSSGTSKSLNKLSSGDFSLVQRSSTPGASVEKRGCNDAARKGQMFSECLEHRLSLQTLNNGEQASAITRKVVKKDCDSFGEKRLSSAATKSNGSVPVVGLEGAAGSFTLKQPACTQGGSRRPQLGGKAPHLRKKKSWLLSSIPGICTGAGSGAAATKRSQRLANGLIKLMALLLLTLQLLPVVLTPSGGRVSGLVQHSSGSDDELSRAVLATMSTQSPPEHVRLGAAGSSDENLFPVVSLQPAQNGSDSAEAGGGGMVAAQNKAGLPAGADSKSEIALDQSTNANADWYDGPFMQFGRIFIMGAIIVGDICGNSLVILSVCRHSKLRVTTNWFVVSLACADILVALFAMTFNASVIISGRWLFKPWVCDFWNSCDVLASTASILHLCCISIDRYIAITRPLDYPMKITTKRVVYALCAVWISSALLSYIPIFTGIYTTAEHIKWLKDNPDQCEFVVNRVYAIVSSSISFWIPCCIMVFTYYRIYKEATRQEKFIYKAQSMMPQPMPNHHHREHGHGHGHHHHHGHHGNSSSSNHLSSKSGKQRRSKSVAVGALGVGGPPQQQQQSSEARIRLLAKQQQQMGSEPVSGKQSISGRTTANSSSIATTRLTGSSQDSTGIQAITASSMQQLDAPTDQNNSTTVDVNNNSASDQQQTATVKIQSPVREEPEECDSSSGQSTPTKRSISKMKREHKAAKTLGIIMGVFILCWLPFFSWYTPQNICGKACEGIVPRGVVTILFWIGYFNSTLNPIIYAYFNHEFRDAFKKTLQWIFCCCQDLKCLRVNRPNDNQHYNCTYRSTQEIGLVSNG